MSKKGGKSAKEVSSYETRDIVLGKVRGYPPWPGMVVDPETVPEPVMKERPATKKTHFYCVRFFPTGDYAWLVSKDISKLQPHEIQSYISEPNKKSGDLLQGYRIALNPTNWEEEREAARRLAAEEEANAEVDQLDSEEDGSGDLDEDDVKAKKSRKRKRESDNALVSTKGKKAPKKADVTKQKKSASASSGKSGKRNSAKKSNEMVESEEEDGHYVPADASAMGISGRGSPPPQKRQKRSGGDEGDDVKNPEASKVRGWRHGLQKCFLGPKGLPKDDDMPAMDALFTMVENYDITIELLQFSKIGKVMRHIAMLLDEKIPCNDKYRFKERADSLVKKWQLIINANKTNGATPLGNASSATISTGPISVVLGSGHVKEDSFMKPAPGQGEDAGTGVAQGTAAINLNGKGEEDAPLSASPDATSHHPPSATVPMSIDPSAFATQDTRMGEGA